jgi:protein-disulfide isomerase
MRADPGRAIIAVLAAVLTVALLGACGSPDDDGQPATSYEAGQTETTERPDRQSSIRAQEAEQTTAESEQTDADPDDDGAVVEVLSRHRAGLQANRNIVGDPDAPITIVEYSDFQ